jgi:hypothetical protein
MIRLFLLKPGISAGISRKKGGITKIILHAAYEKENLTLGVLMPEFNNHFVTYYRHKRTYLTNINILKSDLIIRAST